MPNDADNNSVHPQGANDSIMRSFALLALPWLSFQRDMLAIMKKGIEDTSHVKPVQNLMLLELHALMMILDPSRKWRDKFDAELETRLQETYTETFPKVISGAINGIEAQEAILKNISDMLIKLKKESNPRHPNK